MAGRPIIDLTGQRFGRLTVLRLEGTHVSRGGSREGTLWRCRCDCGKETVVYGRNLRWGNTTSCGGWRCERMRSVGAAWRAAEA
jgi:hypothetical protein